MLGRPMSTGRLHSSDISIGEGRWLRWVESPSEQARTSAVDFDPWIAGLSRLWDALETECVHECCGIGAFSLWPESVRGAVPVSDRHEVLSDLRVLRHRIASLPPSAFIVSGRLNQFMHRDLIRGVVDHLVECLHDREQPNNA